MANGQNKQQGPKLSDLEELRRNIASIQAMVAALESGSPLLQLGQVAPLQQALGGFRQNPLPESLIPRGTGQLGFAPSGGNVHFLGGSPFRLDPGPARLEASLQLLTNILELSKKRRGQETQLAAKTTTGGSNAR